MVSAASQPNCLRVSLRLIIVIGRLNFTAGRESRIEHSIAVTNMGHLMPNSNAIRRAGKPPDRVRPRPLLTLFQNPDKVVADPTQVGKLMLGGWEVTLRIWDDFETAGIGAMPTAAANGRPPLYFTAEVDGIATH